MQAQPSTVAFQRASAQQKPVLLIFSGSDWCIPCRQLRKDVFDQAEFQSFASKNLIVLEADFPQRKKQDKALVEDNESLAEAYNPKGEFPKVLLLNAQKGITLTLTHQQQTVHSFLEQLKPFLPSSSKEQVFSSKTNLMGSSFVFQLVAPEQEKDQAQKWLDQAEQEVRRIERLISSWDPNSQTSRINQMAGIGPVVVDPELFDLIERSIQLSKLTQGAFDISFAGLDDLWVFDGSQTQLPNPDTLSKRLQTIGYDKIVLDKAAGTVFLSQKGMKIGFGGIGKGYAADRVSQLWSQQGIEHSIVNAGGDLLARGRQSEGQAWQVGIADPQQPQHIMAWLDIENQAIATSGDYERFFILNGNRYSHIINPKTGYPATGIKSVSVLSPSAELADALASAVFVLGVDIGLNTINQLPEVECLIVDDKNQLHTSNKLDIQTTQLKNP